MAHSVFALTGFDSVRRNRKGFGFQYNYTKDSATNVSGAVYVHSAFPVGGAAVKRRIS